MTKGSLGYLSYLGDYFQSHLLRLLICVVLPPPFCLLKLLVDAVLQEQTVFKVYFAKKLYRSG
jgi:hypothetical protein